MHESTFKNFNWDFPLPSSVTTFLEIKEECNLFFTFFFVVTDNNTINLLINKQLETCTERMDRCSIEKKRGFNILEEKYNKEISYIENTIYSNLLECSDHYYKERDGVVSSKGCLQEIEYHITKLIDLKKNPTIPDFIKKRDLEIEILKQKIIGAKKQIPAGETDTSCFILPYNDSKRLLYYRTLLIIFYNDILNFLKQLLEWETTDFILEKTSTVSERNFRIKRFEQDLRGIQSIGGNYENQENSALIDLINQFFTPGGPDELLRIIHAKSGQIEKNLNDLNVLYVLSSETQKSVNELITKNKIVGNEIPTKLSLVEFDSPKETDTDAKTEKTFRRMANRNNKRRY